MDHFCYLSFMFVMLSYLSLQPCGHLLGKGLPIGSIVCDVFLCFCHFLIGCLGSGMVLVASIPDLCLLTYFRRVPFRYDIVKF